MKIFACIVLLSAILVSGLLAQAGANSAAKLQPEQIGIASGVAEKLLIHKADIICPRVPMAARVMATVIVAFEIDINGNVLHPNVVSGPAMLRKPVLDAVRKYKYKPYLLNGKAVEVETTVSVTMDSYLDCHFN
jgi:protein TonB